MPQDTGLLVGIITAESGIIVGLVGWVGNKVWTKTDRLQSSMDMLNTLYAVHVAEHEQADKDQRSWDGRERRRRPSN